VVMAATTDPSFRELVMYQPVNHSVYKSVYHICTVY
jgi:hypothetical protein